MKELILEALRESVKRYPDLFEYIDGKAAWIIIRDDLLLWQAKAITQARNGEPALCEFESAYIPPSIADMVKDALAYAGCQEDIERGFEELDPIIRDYAYNKNAYKAGGIDRNELERRLTKIISAEMRGELKILLDHLGDPPNLDNVPFEYWRNGWKKLRKAVEPFLVDIFIDYAEAVMVQTGIGIEWTIVNRNASEWSRNHGETVLQKLFDHTYEGVSQTVPQYFEQGWTSKELARELERYYSTVRAEMIAVTETTRAAVEGERAYVEQLEAETGRKMIPIWLTANDERVCPICGPKHEKPITDNEFPPAHPRCRCNVAWEFETTLNEEQARLWAGGVVGLSEWKDAGSIKEAEDYARQILGIENVNYEGLDLRLVNEINKITLEYINKYPALKDKMQYLGSIQGIQSDIRDKYFEEIYKKYYDYSINMGSDDRVAAVQAKRWANSDLKKMYPIAKENNWGYSVSSPFEGIVFNQKQSWESLESGLKHALDTQYHPFGCDTVRSIIDHELGHRLDRLLSISANAQIQSLRSNLRDNIPNDLSTYARKNIYEFVAEAWAEYINNPNPRAIASEVGSIVEELYKNYGK